MNYNNKGSFLSVFFTWFFFYKYFQMKTITHPSPQFQMYNKVLQFISFPISFCFAVENLWITALMISYDTPNILDSFVWITPNIIAILIRPYIITYVHKTISPRQAQISIISNFLLLGILGCILVSISSQYFEDFKRIAVCVLGWILMDISFQIVSFFSDKTKDRLEKLGYKQIKSEDNHCSFFGELFGYSLSFGLCYLRSGKTMKKFFTNSFYIYIISATISFIYWIALYFSCKDPTITHPKKKQNQKIQTVKKTLPQFLPGIYEFIRSNRKQKWLLSIHFTKLFIVDTLLIYGSMWIVMVYDDIGEKQGVAYNLGMKEGSLVLLTYTLSSQFNLIRLIKSQKIRIRNLINSLMVLFVAVCMVSSCMFIKANHYFIFGLAFIIGMIDGGYSKIIYPKIEQKFPCFGEVSQLIERLQKIIILCPMPFIVMIILGRDDISDCLLCLPIVVGLMSILSLFLKQNGEKIKGKQKILEKKE